jgi:hypothetical protein
MDLTGNKSPLNKAFSPPRLRDIDGKKKVFAPRGANVALSLVPCSLSFAGKGVLSAFNEK